MAGQLCQGRACQKSLVSIVEVDFDAVTHMLLGGLLTYVIMNLVVGEEAHLPELDRADAVVEVIMRALTP